jgi:hypothetical protein
MAYRDGVPIADCVLEAALWNHAVKIACKCGHAVYFDPQALWWLYGQRGWHGSFREMRRHYYCSRCYLRTRRKVRPTISAEGREQPTVDLPHPPDNEWQRARRRYR